MHRVRMEGQRQQVQADLPEVRGDDPALMPISFVETAGDAVDFRSCR